MPRPGGGSIGHRKHRQAFGTQPVSRRQKLRIEMDARKREAEKKRKPKPEMKSTLKELFA
jgi:hypothetical protein